MIQAVGAIGKVGAGGGAIDVVMRWTRSRSIAVVVPARAIGALRLPRSTRDWPSPGRCSTGSATCVVHAPTSSAHSSK